MPEVESARRSIATHAVGRVITAVLTEEQGGGPREGQYDEIVLSGFAAAELRAALVGRSISAASRKGKVQLWHLSGGSEKGKGKGAAAAAASSAAVTALTVHFGMTGSVHVKGQPGPTYKSIKPGDDVWPPRFTKLELVLAGGGRIALTDPRRLARVHLIRGDPAAALADLAPDAWTQLPPLPVLADALAARKVPIKALLLDQNKVRLWV